MQHSRKWNLPRCTGNLGTCTHRASRLGSRTELQWGLVLMRPDRDPTTALFHLQNRSTWCVSENTAGTFRPESIITTLQWGQKLTRPPVAMFAACFVHETAVGSKGRGGLDCSTPLHPPPSSVTPEISDRKGERLLGDTLLSLKAMSSDTQNLQFKMKEGLWHQGLCDLRVFSVF